MLLLLRKPGDVEVELERSTVCRVVSVEVLLQEVDNRIGVVIVAGRREDTLIGMMTSVELIPQRIDRNLPQAREGLGGTLQGAAEVRRLPADAHLATLQRFLRNRRRVLLLLLQLQRNLFARQLIRPPDITTTTTPKTLSATASPGAIDTSVLVVARSWAILLVLLRLVRTIERLAIVIGERPIWWRAARGGHTRVVHQPKVVSHLEHRIATGPNERSAHADHILAGEHWVRGGAGCIGQDDLANANHLLGPVRVVGTVRPPRLRRSMTLVDKQVILNS